MSGERSLYFIEMAERGAQRLAERLEMIKDRYAAPEDVITAEEIAQEERLLGHTPPGDGCNSPTCVKARRMFATALAAMAAQGAQQ